MTNTNAFATTFETAFETIDINLLAEINGGLDVGKVFNSAVDDAGRYGTLGTLGGGAAGSVVPGVGTLTGAGAGGLIGAGVGFLWGAGREVYRQMTAPAPAPAPQQQPQQRPAGS